jgi:membrane carboxypeptidase/penicillin-binding protein
MKTFFANLVSNIKSAFMFDLKTYYGIKKLIFVSIFLSISFYLFWGIPLPTKLSAENQAVSTKIFDRNGKLIYEIFTDKKRTPIKLSEIPQTVKNATLSIEDKDFYKHQGFSFTGITRAFITPI